MEMVEKKSNETAVRVVSLSNNSLIAEKCIVANRFLARLKGLIGTTRLEPGEGLLLSPCNDIHMWFMSVAIDVVFIAPAPPAAPGGQAVEGVWRVTSVRESLRPWKLLPARDGRAKCTLELPAGTVRRCGIAAGDELCIS